MLASDFKARNREFYIGQNVEFISFFSKEILKDTQNCIKHFFASDEYNSSHVHDIHV